MVATVNSIFIWTWARLNTRVISYIVWSCPQEVIVDVDSYIAVCSSSLPTHYTANIGNLSDEIFAPIKSLDYRDC